MVSPDHRPAQSHHAFLRVGSVCDLAALDQVLLNEVKQLHGRYSVANEGEMFDIMNILDDLLKQSSSAVVLSVTKAAFL